MDSPEQNVVASAQLPKPAALQHTAQDAFATSTGTPIFDAKGISTARTQTAPMAAMPDRM